MILDRIVNPPKECLEYLIMKLISFDIGIKNLAYCVIDSELCSILDWGVLDISTCDKCEHIMKGMKPCEKDAKVTINNTRLCTAHQKLSQYKGLKSKKIPKQINPMLQLGQKLVSVLDEHPIFLTVDHVLLENQPALKNPTMKSVQMLVYSYFLIKGVTFTTSPTKNIEMINARNKLKAYKGEPIPCDIKDRYKRTKWLGIQYCEKMISENTQIEECYKTLFKSSKKRDDLADAYLQGMYWLSIQK